MSFFEDYYQNLEPELIEYFKIISPVFPKFLIPFIETATMMRLKDISYLCSMDKGNKEFFNFKFPLSRLDHSISTALMVWNHTFNPEMTVAALFHDAGTPALSHVIDYMNEDFEKQESTEIDLTKILTKDDKLIKLIELNNFDINNIVNYKQYPLIDNQRPYLCADRLDGIFLTSLVWPQNLTLEEIKNIYKDLIVRENENQKQEFGFIAYMTADKVIELNEIIDKLTKSDEDYISMISLAKCVAVLIREGIITKENLHILVDRDIFRLIFKYQEEFPILHKYYSNFKKSQGMDLSTRKPVKNRGNLNPLVLNLRYSSF